jgi:hypothetical protein
MDRVVNVSPCLKVPVMQVVKLRDIFRPVWGVYHEVFTVEVFYDEGRAAVFVWCISIGLRKEKSTGW